jgi:tetratricopeptide (TPR) repeat protein
LERLDDESLSPEESLKWSARLWNNFGINHEILLDYNRAHEALEKSRNAARELNNHEGEWITAINEGLLLCRMGSVDEAVSLLQDASAFFSSTGDLGNEGKDWLNLGLAEAKRKNFEVAIQAANQAIDLFEMVNDSTELYNALINKGESFLLSGELGGLGELFEQMDVWRPQRLSIRQQYHEKVLIARWEICRSNLAAAQQYLDSPHELSGLAAGPGLNLSSIEALMEIDSAQWNPQIAFDELLTQISDFEQRTNELPGGSALQVVQLQK